MIIKGSNNIHLKSTQRRQEYFSCLSLNIKRNNTNIPRNFKSLQKKVPLAEQCYSQQVSKPVQKDGYSNFKMIQLKS